MNIQRRESSGDWSDRDMKLSTLGPGITEHGTPENSGTKEATNANIAGIINELEA